MTGRELFVRADAVLSDLDGTLVDSSAPVRRARTGFASRHALNADEVLSFAHGRPARETIRLLAPTADHQAETELMAWCEENDTDGLVALPGAREILAGAAPVAIVTSCSAALARTRLEAAGLPVPEVLISCDDVTHGKPDPTCFLLGAERLGVDPSRCVVLEDAPAGITAGRRAGVTVIAVRTTHGDDDLVDAQAIVDDLSSLVIH